VKTANVVLTLMGAGVPKRLKAPYPELKSTIAILGEPNNREYNPAGKSCDAGDISAETVELTWLYDSSLLSVTHLVASFALERDGIHRLETASYFEEASNCLFAWQQRSTPPHLGGSYTEENEVLV
jgi:hypothetical protein